MDKQRLRVVLKVLEAVKTQIPEAKQLIEDLVEEECQKEKISVDELWGNSENSKKTKRLNKDEIKKQLIDSLTINNTVETEELNNRAERVEKPEDTADIIKEYEEILRTKRKGIILVAFYQGKVFKHFKEKENFIQMVGKLKIHKSTMVFKIDVFKLIEKHPKLMKSSVT